MTAVPHTCEHCARWERDGDGDGGFCRFELRITDRLLWTHLTYTRAWHDCPNWVDARDGKPEPKQMARVP